MTTKKSTKKNVVPPVERPAPDGYMGGETPDAVNPEEDIPEDPSEPVPQEERPADNPDNATSPEQTVNPQDAYNHLPIVLVVTKNEKLAELISISIDNKFDSPVAAIIPDYDPEKSLVEKITDMISSHENETVILFDSLVPVTPFSLQDVITIYAERTKEGWNYNAKTPVALERSKIVGLLEENPDISDANFLNAYFRKFHADILPIVTDWRNDTFTLPIVSENPPFKTLFEYQSKKRWFYVSDASVNAVLKFSNA